MATKNEEIYSDIYNAPEQDYSMHNAEFLADLCKMKDKTLKQYAKHLAAARDVIDLIAEYIGVANKDLCIYGVYEDGTTPILDALKRYLDNCGDKVKLKKRINELETENSVLRNLVRN